MSSVFTRAAASFLVLASSVACSIPPSTTPAAKPLTEAQFAALTQTDNVGGLTTSTLRPATAVETNVDEAATAYLGITSCRAYWQSAHDSLLSSWTATSSGDEEILIETSAELWKDAKTASDASAQWLTCLADYQKKKTPAVRYPLKVVKNGTIGDTTWSFSSNNAPADPLNELTLRNRNVIMTVRLAGDPSAEWRDRLVQRFADDVTRAAQS